MKASYILSKHIAVKGKHLKDGEFWKVCSEEIFRECFGGIGDEIAKHVAQIPASKTTVANRITDISKYVIKVLRIKLKNRHIFQ